MSDEPALILAKKIALAKLIQEGKEPCLDPFFECRLEDVFKKIIFTVTYATRYLERIVDAYIDNENKCYRIITLSGDMQVTKKRPKLFYHHKNVPTSSFFSKNIMPDDTAYKGAITVLEEMYEVFDKLESGESLAEEEDDYE